MIAFGQGRLEDAAALRKQNLLAACELGSLQSIAQGLCRNASAFAQIVGKAGVAARLLSYFEAQRQQIGVSESWIATLNEETLAAIHEQLDEAAFTEAWDQGRTLTVEEAVRHTRLPRLTARLEAQWPPLLPRRDNLHQCFRLRVG